MLCDLRSSARNIDPARFQGLEKGDVYPQITQMGADKKNLKNLRSSAVPSADEFFPLWFPPLEKELPAKDAKFSRKGKDRKYEALCPSSLCV